MTAQDAAMDRSTWEGRLDSLWRRSAATSWAFAALLSVQKEPT